jgi:hypothetical protein
MKPKTDEELMAELAVRTEQRRKDFAERFEALSRECGFTFGAHIAVTPDGRLAANLLIVERPTDAHA